MFRTIEAGAWRALIATLMTVAIGVRLASGATTEALAGQPACSRFAAENSVAMRKMMTAMSAKPSGDVDRDFVAMMSPHHQGAIDMALAELRYGKDETLRRMAQEIIVEQQQEIVAMKVAAERLKSATDTAAGPGEICTAAAMTGDMRHSSMPGDHSK